MERATIDFESRSAISLKAHGAWRYSLDASTDVFCMAFRLPYWDQGITALWHPAQWGFAVEGDLEQLRELFDWIAAGELVEAHGAWFEFSIWRNIMETRYGWPRIQNAQWRCSAAKAATHALPRGLDKALTALKSPIVKDTDARPLLLKMTKPRKPRKKELEAWEAAGQPTLWHETTEQLERLFVYCRRDVLAEEALSHALPDLSEHETDMFLMDLAINERGFRLDPEAVRVALVRIAKEAKRLNDELSILTGGKITQATQRTKLLHYLQDKGLDLPDTQAATVDTYLSNEYACAHTLHPDDRRVLEILRELGRSSTAKYEAMQLWQCPDHRVRGGLLYHGASTGRWTGVGVQPHNFPKGHIKDMEAIWRALKELEQPAGMDMLAQALRGAIVSAPGKALFVADYASIEARVLHWLADDEDTLELFRTGADLYCVMASDIYKRAIMKADTTERALGKIAVLGLGYQMGWAKFVDTCALFKIEVSDELAQRVVATYRERFWQVRDMWQEQNDAAIKACQVRTPVCEGRITWLLEGRFLYAVLPSGRRLAYADPQLRIRETPWGAKQLVVSYKGINSLTHQWQRQYTYGGKIVENLVQAIARDIMADALLRCAQSGVYQPVLSVHDELIAEAHPHWGSMLEFLDLLTALPAWARGCPIAAEGWQGFRYKKG